MGETTGISWTDHTFNPWWGCTKVSPGCDHCYAETLDHRYGGEHWGKGRPRRLFGEKHWNEPLKWNRDALKTFGRPARVFCASMADIFDEEAPKQEQLRLWDLIDCTPNLIWQLLTKRPNGYLSKLPSRFLSNARVWKGVTCEDHPRYMLRWVKMQQLPGITWISYEPALTAIHPETLKPPYPAWWVFGGESGNSYRDCERRWADTILAHCKEWHSSFFMKQMSARTPREGKELIPIDLKIQDFPHVRT